MTTTTLQIPTYLMQKIKKSKLDLSDLVRSEIETYFEDKETFSEKNMRNILINAVEESEENYKQEKFTRRETAGEVKKFFNVIFHVFKHHDEAYKF